MQVTVVVKPDTSKSNSFYCTNRHPLSANPLVKLPLGSIRPGGWLKHQIELMAEGMTGHLPELSRFLTDDNGWFGSDNPGWEEQPYWLRGFYPMAVISGNKRCLAEAKRWMEAVLTSQDEDGYFGAKYHKRIEGKNGKVVTDLWPHMVMLDAVIQYYEYTGDERVIAFMKRFFEFCRDLPEEMFVPKATWQQYENYKQDFGDWKPRIQLKRAGDMLSHIYWLYNHTGDEWLLKLASRFYDHILPPMDEWLDDHVVHFTQRFAYPGIYSQQSGRAWHLAQTEYWYAQHLGTWGQQPRGIFAADERIRPGKTDPRQAIETCAMVEFAKNFYILGRVTGQAKYADRCEDVMLNHFPASQTPDLKALHYLTASNQPQLDANRNHEYHNKGQQLLYSPHTHRCCQHNVAMGWPWYAQNLWQATADNGLSAWLYAESDVTAKVGQKGNNVTIKTRTDYPFKGTVQMTVITNEPAKFPIYLRVPRWCTGFSVTVNGQKLNVDAQPQMNVRIERLWSKGDTVNINMQMGISLTEWPRTGSVTVDRGPLSYSIRIEEKWKRYGTNEEWPEWEVFPDSPWNYGLLIDRENPEASLKVTVNDVMSEQPWTVKDAPIEIKAKAKRIANWKLQNNTVEELQPSPIKSDAPGETITMIPLGCARLRMSCLPTIGDGPGAHEWERR